MAQVRQHLNAKLTPLGRPGRDEVAGKWSVPVVYSGLRRWPRSDSATPATS